ncbi:MAG: hypothetical protein HYT87_12640 [Nitrospirae bacterium]|nr:hypothetical protein [Nitrospirota bacterium]
MEHGLPGGLPAILAWFLLVAPGVLFGVSCEGGGLRTVEKRGLFTFEPAPGSYTFTEIAALGGVRVSGEKTKRIFYRFSTAPVVGDLRTSVMKNGDQIPAVAFPGNGSAPTLEAVLYVAAELESGDVSEVVRVDYKLDLPPHIFFDPPVGTYAGAVKGSVKCNEGCSLVVGRTAEGADRQETLGNDSMEFDLDKNTEVVVVAKDSANQVRQVTVHYTIGAEILLTIESGSCSEAGREAAESLIELRCKTFPARLTFTSNAGKLEFSLDGQTFAPVSGEVAVGEAGVVLVRASSGAATRTFQLVLGQEGDSKIFLSPKPGSYRTGFTLRVLSIPRGDVTVTIVGRGFEKKPVTCKSCSFEFKEEGTYNLLVSYGVMQQTVVYVIDSKAPVVTLIPEPGSYSVTTSKQEVRFETDETAKVNVVACQDRGKCTEFKEVKRIGLPSGAWTLLYHSVDGADNVSAPLQAVYTISQSRTVLPNELKIEATRNISVQGGFFPVPVNPSTKVQASTAYPPYPTVAVTRADIKRGVMCTEAGLFAPSFTSTLTCTDMDVGDAPLFASGNSVYYGNPDSTAGASIVISWPLPIEEVRATEPGKILFLDNAASVCICTPPYDCGISSSADLVAIGQSFAMVKRTVSGSSTKENTNIACRKLASGSRLIGAIYDPNPAAPASTAADPLLDFATNVVVANSSGGAFTVSPFPSKSPLNGTPLFGDVRLPYTVIFYRDTSGRAHAVVWREIDKEYQFDEVIPIDPAGFEMVGDKLLVCGGQGVYLVSAGMKQYVYLGETDIVGCGINSNFSFIVVEKATGGNPNKIKELDVLAQNATPSGRAVSLPQNAHAKVLTAKDSVIVGLLDTGTGLSGFTADFDEGTARVMGSAALMRSNYTYPDIDPSVGTAGYTAPAFKSGPGAVLAMASTSGGDAPVVIGYRDVWFNLPLLVGGNKGIFTGERMTNTATTGNQATVSVPSTAAQLAVYKAPTTSLAGDREYEVWGPPEMYGVPALRNPLSTNPVPSAGIQCDLQTNAALPAIQTPCIYFVGPDPTTLGTGSSHKMLWSMAPNAGTAYRSTLSTRWGLYLFDPDDIHVFGNNFAQASDSATDAPATYKNRAYPGGAVDSAAAGSLAAAGQTDVILKVVQGGASKITLLDFSGSKELGGVGSSSFMDLSQAVVSAGSWGDVAMDNAGKGLVLSPTKQIQVTRGSCTAPVCPAAFSFPYLWVQEGGGSAVVLKQYELYSFTPPAMASPAGVTFSWKPATPIIFIQSDDSSLSIDVGTSLSTLKPLPKEGLSLEAVSTLFFKIPVIGGAPVSSVKLLVREIGTPDKLE